MELRLNPFSSLESYYQYFIQESWIDFLLNHVDPMLAFKKIKAKVKSIQTEAKDVISIELQPNFHWKGFLPGQYLQVGIPIYGKIYKRAYSITSSVRSGTIKITVKKHSKGIVSNYIHSSLKVGDIIEIEPAMGKFHLPESIASKLLFIAGGSGITPIYSILQKLKEDNFNGSVNLLYFCKSQEDIIFSDELIVLQKQLKNFHLDIFFTSGDKALFQNTHITEGLLSNMVPDFLERATYICGPESLLESCLSIWKQNNALSKIFWERFSLNPKKETSNITLENYKISLLNSKKDVHISNQDSLLVELEKNGIYPKHGCRMGICHTCKCVKKTGITLNTMDNVTSDHAKEEIQLCISKAVSDIQLEL